MVLVIEVMNGICCAKEANVFGWRINNQYNAVYKRLDNAKLSTGDS